MSIYPHTKYICKYLNQVCQGHLRPRLRRHHVDADRLRHIRRHLRGLKTGTQRTSQSCQWHRLCVLGIDGRRVTFEGHAHRSGKCLSFLRFDYVRLYQVQL